MIKLTARELKEANIVEKVIEEPKHFTVETLSSVCDNLAAAKISCFCGNIKKKRGMILQKNVISVSERCREEQS